VLLTDVRRSLCVASYARVILYTALKRTPAERLYCYAFEPILCLLNAYVCTFVFLGYICLWLFNKICSISEYEYMASNGRTAVNNEFSVGGNGCVLTSDVTMTDRSQDSRSSSLSYRFCESMLMQVVCVLLYSHSVTFTSHHILDFFLGWGDRNIFNLCFLQVHYILLRFKE
jgi:hypothetical protein